ncbi:MAG: hypothetical protein WCD70_15850, partial [Alphaproteobacteria bacterium]
MNVQFCAYLATGSIYCALSVFFSLLSLKKFRQSPQRQGRSIHPDEQSRKNSEVASVLSFPCALACLLTALWAFSSASHGPDQLSNITLDILQSLGWLWVLVKLFCRFTPDQQISRLNAKASLVIFLAAGAIFVALLAAPRQLYLYNVYIKIMLAVMTLVIAENIYRNAPAAIRWHLNFLCISISAMATFSLLLYGD